jgi:hypothetical protein
VTDVSQWHASPKRGAPVTREPDTGEMRVPISLFTLDAHEGDVQLVLSWVEAEHLHATLGRLLARGMTAAPTGRPA